MEEDIKLLEELEELVNQLDDENLKEQFYEKKKEIESSKEVVKKLKLYNN